MENADVLKSELMSTRGKMKGNQNAEAVRLSNRDAYSR